MSSVAQVNTHERAREAPVDYSLIFRSGMLHWMREAYLLARLSGLEGIQEWQRAMKTALHAGYEAAGAPRNSGPEGFLRYVVERDKYLGISAGGEILEREGRKVLSFRYWIVDPFIDVRDRLKKIELENEKRLTDQELENEYRRISTEGYLAAKIDYFCSDFKPEMLKSTWRGDDRTEWVLRR